MAMVNVNNILNVKDSRWLQLEVCREFQRNKCTRPDTECKFAHPPANVEVQNGRVTACYDSIKGRCNREKPPCKYFHPPQHLKDQLLINGRNHLALKNALMQQMGLTPGQPLVPGQVPTVASSPYLTGVPQVGSTFSPYFTQSPLVPLVPPEAQVASPLGVVPQSVVTPQKVPRSDRLEAFPGMVPYKRPAGDKSGLPVYQPNATAYQQLMQLQQPFVPVSCEYPSASAASSPSSATTTATTTTTTTTTTTAAATTTTTAAPQIPTLPASASTSPVPSMAAAAAAAANMDSGVTHAHTHNPHNPHHMHILYQNSMAAAAAAAAAANESPSPSPPNDADASTSPVLNRKHQQHQHMQHHQVPTSSALVMRQSYPPGMNPVTVLSYTGVALNKQPMVAPPQPPPPPPPPTPQHHHLAQYPFFAGIPQFHGFPTAGMSYQHHHQMAAAAALAQRQPMMPQFSLGANMGANLGVGANLGANLAGANLGAMGMSMAAHHHAQMNPQVAAAAAAAAAAHAHHQAAAAQQAGLVNNFLSQYPMATQATTTNNNNLLLLNANVQPAKRMKTM